MSSMVYTCLDIALFVSVVSRYIFNPGKRHWEAIKWTNVGIAFQKLVEVFQFSVMWILDLDKRTSTTGYLFTLVGSILSRKSTIQSIAVLSTTKA